MHFNPSLNTVSAAILVLTLALVLQLSPGAEGHMSVIGAGLARTGSNSFKAALGILLDGPTQSLENVAFNEEAREGWLELVRNPKDENNTALLLRLVEGYEAVNGPPACFFYKRLLLASPDAKVVVTQHPKGPRGWYKSTMGTIFKLNYEVFNSTWIGRVPPFRFLHPFLREMYLDSPLMLSREDWQREEVAVKRYADWTAELTREVPPERLLIFDPTEGWEPLCAFLGKPVPSVPYPHHISKGATIKRMIVLFKVIRVAVPVTFLMILLVFVWLFWYLFIAQTGERKRQKKD